MATTNTVLSDASRPDIIDSIISAQSLELTLFVSENLTCFAGHFPDFPILPGVVQLDWAIHYAGVFLGLTAPVINIERLKFTCPIQPNMQVKLNIDVNAAKTCANFRFHSPAHESTSQPLTFSQGRLVYA